MIILTTYQDEIWQRDKDFLCDLMDTTTLDERQKAMYRVKICLCEASGDYEEMEKFFYQNTIEDKDRVAMGLSYSQTDLMKHLQDLK